MEDGEIALCDTVQFYRVGTSLESRVQIILGPMEVYFKPTSRLVYPRSFSEGTRSEKKSLNLQYTRVYIASCKFLPYINDIEKKSNLIKRQLKNRMRSIDIAVEECRER